MMMVAMSNPHEKDLAKPRSRACMHMSWISCFGDRIRLACQFYGFHALGTNEMDFKTHDVGLALNEPGTPTACALRVTFTTNGNIMLNVCCLLRVFLHIIEFI